MINDCFTAAQPIIGPLLVFNAALLMMYMTAWYIVARTRQRIDTVDIAWGLGFVLIAWGAFGLRPSTRSLVIAILVSLWGLRLASHIYARSKLTGEDRRYQEISRKWQGNFWLRAYLSIFLLQGAFIWLVGLPIALATNWQLARWEWLTIAGSLIWLVGFIVEVVADRQLARFIRTKKHPKVLQTGLWKYSRHPNYFGEITQWWGIGLIACQVSYGWGGLLGPLALTLLIVFVSGIPPIEKRRAKDAAYRKYQQRTSALIPWPPKSSKS